MRRPRATISASAADRVGGFADFSRRRNIRPTMKLITPLVTDRTMAEHGDGSAHLGGDDDIEDDWAPPRTQ
jgi:hypothetical protein